MARKRTARALKPKPKSKPAPARAKSKPKPAPSRAKVKPKPASRRRAASRPTSWGFAILAATAGVDKSPRTLSGPEHSAGPTLTWLDVFGSPTPALRTRIITSVLDSSTMADLRADLSEELAKLGVIVDSHVYRRPARGSHCSLCGATEGEHQADAMARIFQELYFARRKGFNLYFSGIYPEVGWNY